MKTIAGLLALSVTMPIWFYLLYQMLEAVHATQLMWFLYWVYVPASLLVTYLIKLYEKT